MECATRAGGVGRGEGHGAVRGLVHVAAGVGRVGGQGAKYVIFVEEIQRRKETLERSVSMFQRDVVVFVVFFPLFCLVVK